MNLFGKTIGKTPKEQVREWTSQLRKEGYALDRQIRAIQREEEKTKRMLKDAAKRGDTDVCRILAKEIVAARKSVNRIHTSKAHLNSVQLSMNHQLALLKVSGSLERSTEVMQSMQNLVKVPEIARTMQDLSKEMMKAGIIEEMMEDTFESVFDDEGLEEEAGEEVDKLLWELTAGQLGTAPAAVSESLPDATMEAASASAASDTDLTDMEMRLEALRS